MTGGWRAVDVQTGRTVYAPTAERAVYAAVRADIPTTRMRIERNGEPNMEPPPPPPIRFNGLWDDVEQARRAWAVTQACREAAGTNRLLTHILADADAILAWTEHPPSGAEGSV